MTARGGSRVLRGLVLAVVLGAATMAAGGCGLLGEAGAASSPSAAGGSPSASPSASPAGDGGLGLSLVAPADRTAPLELSGPTRAGGTLDLASLRGKVVVLNSWASWCDPCQAELPVLAAESRAADPAVVRFVGLNVQDTADAARAMTDRFGIRYDSIVDPKALLLAHIPGVPPEGLPSTVVLDRQGRVAARVIGAVTPGMLAPVIAAVAAEKN